MGIYNKPKVKVWQTLGDDIVKWGPITGKGVPDFTPAAAGVVYVDIEGPAIYISSGISSPSDWRFIWD